VSRRYHDRGDRAERILPDNQADLIAIGREIRNNPNRSADAALKPGEQGVLTIP
jgi:2,4-dienoyl-CoA reductase-like NADH-dependent reductase (Old Yellow Enzyme family)